MKLTSLDIPSEQGDLVPWLERHLVGNELGALIAELSVVSNEEASGPPFPPSVLGKLQAIYSNGLDCLTLTEIRQLLNSPRSLLSLQESILENAGPYWLELSARGSNAPSQSQVEAQWEVLWASLRETMPKVGAAPAPQSATPVAAMPDAATSPTVPLTDAPTPAGSEVDETTWNYPVITAVVACAALFLAGFFLNDDSASADWGWNKIELTKVDGSQSDYLNRIAAAADEWFTERPEDKAGVATRLAELRQGCARLIAAQHELLDAKNRAWLLERCRAWDSKLLEQEQSLQAGTSPKTVLREVDAVVGKLVNALRQRASSV